MRNDVCLAVSGALGLCVQSIKGCLNIILTSPLAFFYPFLLSPDLLVVLPGYNLLFSLIYSPNFRISRNTKICNISSDGHQLYLTRRPIYNVSQKIPLSFSDIFPKRLPGWEFFVQILHAYIMHSYLGLRWITNCYFLYLQLDEVMPY